jgi:hypothetical protein
MVLMTLLIAGLGLYQLRGFWQPAYAYQVGTPATAIIDHCDKSDAPRPIVTCTGSWTVAGETQSGIIDGADQMLDTGSSLDVRVKDGAAYTPRSVHMAIFYVIFFGLVLIGLCGLMIRALRRMRAAR